MILDYITRMSYPLCERNRGGVKAGFAPKQQNSLLRFAKIRIWGMKMHNSEFYRECLPYARGEAPAELVIRNARLANVFSLEYEQADVAIAKGIVVGVGTGYAGLESFDAEGQILIPGMIDGHFHVESAMLTPRRFAEAAVPLGTAAVMADPHEIANVLGIEGVLAMQKNAEGLPLDFFWGAPSCVPASEFETCRETLDASALKGLFDRSVCQHLGEMMNYPAVIGGCEAVWRKIAIAGDRPLSAHSPRVSGRDLCAYLLSGCIADHESASYEEALEKLRRGGWVMMRSGAAANELPLLIQLVKENPARSSRCMAVSDDLTPTALKEKGHMDAKVRTMCSMGVDPLVALRMVTLAPAEYFGLKRRGGIAPGWIADMALVDSLESCKASTVWKAGRLAAQGGVLCKAVGNEFILGEKQTRLSIETKEPRVQALPGKNRIRVIGWKNGSLLTEELHMDPRVEEGLIVADPARDIAKLIVQERTQTGRQAIGFVQGLGLRQGAIGASVAHDAHPFAVAGVDDRSILYALNWLKEQGGGIVVCEGDRVLASLSLPVAGLMSDKPLAEVADGLAAVDAAAAKLGITGRHPCMALSFLSLSVIPELKLTDQGYVNLTRGGWQSLYAD